MVVLYLCPTHTIIQVCLAKRARIIVELNKQLVKVDDKEVANDISE